MRYSSKAVVTSKSNITDGFANLYSKIPESLEDIENQIYSLTRRVAHSIWYIGKRLIYIRDNRLYKEQYKSFDEYCIQRLGFTKQTALNMMFVAENFDEGKVLYHGTKLYLLKPLSASQREKVLSWLDKKNRTFRQTKEKVEQLLTQDGVDVFEPPSISRARAPYSLKIDLNALGIKDVNVKNYFIENEDFEIKLKNFLIEFINESRNKNSN